MRLLLPMLGVVLLLAACKPAANVSGPAATDAADAPANTPNSSPDTAHQGPAPAPAAPQLAMAYHYGLALPADQVRPMMESHQDACERAGTLQCQVLGATAKSQGAGDADAQLTLRATPAWMRMFRTRAEADVKGVGGRVDDAGTTGEDLSAPIVDAQATQHARVAELARLQGLMARRTKNLQDTLDVEKEITRVQGEMDQATSDMALMNSRVVMQTVTVDYSSLGAFASPVTVAGRSFVGHVMGAFAFILTMASYTLPFALVGAPLVWFFTRRGKKASVPTA